MKNIKFLLGMGLIAGFLASCAPETIPADEDTVPDGKYTVNYGVQVVPIGDVSRGLNGASVTIQTQNGVTTKTVGADGVAVFEGLAAGTISGYVSAPGFASVNFKAYCASNNVDVNTNGYVSSTVYIPAKNSDVNGRVYGDLDNDGDATITQNANTEILNLFIKYAITGDYPLGTGDGALTQVSLDYYTYAKSTDDDGFFTFSDMPNTDLGYLSAVLRMEDYMIIDTDYQIIYNFSPLSVYLQPGETLEMGDIVAN
jgi:hypothetical protein